MGVDLSNRIRMIILSFSEKLGEKLGKKCDGLAGR
jgi:hypothetical protein